MKYKAVKGYPNYIIFKDGRVFREVKPSFRENYNKNKTKKYPYVNLAYNGKKKNCAVISLTAKHFVENWDNKMMPKLKDGNPANTSADNIVWEDLKHTPKYGDRHEAKETAICKYLKQYYDTLDEKFIHQSWKATREQLTIKGIKDIESNMFEYFYARCRRFTLVGNPVGLMILYSKTAKAELRKATIEFNEQYKTHSGGRANI